LNALFQSGRYGNQSPIALELSIANGGYIEIPEIQLAPCCSTNPCPSISWGISPPGSPVLNTIPAPVVLLGMIQRRYKQQT